MNLQPLRLLLLLSLLVLVSPCVFAAETAGKAEAAADPDWAAFQQAMQPAPSPKDTDYAGRIRWGMMFVQGILTTGQNFYDRHPADPRRWDCVMQMVKQFGSWTGGINGREDGKKAANAVFQVSGCFFDAKSVSVKSGNHPYPHQTNDIKLNGI